MMGRPGRWLKDKVGRRVARSQPAHVNIILCGCDAIHYGWLRALPEPYRVVAMVTEAPWQHGTQVGDVALYYPSEVEALCRRLAVRHLVYAEPEERRAITAACGPLESVTWHQGVGRLEVDRAEPSGS